MAEPSEGTAGDDVARDSAGRAEQPTGRRPTAARRFLNRFVPAEERVDALWVLGVATLLWSARVIAYRPLLRVIDSLVYSPNAEIYGFPLRATAITDLLWGVLAGIFILLVLRFTRAPRGAALYIALAGVAVTLVSLGDRLALNAVAAVAGSEYHRSLWSDLQPTMLAAAEAVGVVVGAWIAQVTSGDAPAAGGGTLLPALGWTSPPRPRATRLALAYTAARLVSGLVAALLLFVPLAYASWEFAKGSAISDIQWTGAVEQAVLPVVFFLVGYVGVKRYQAPVTVWLAFMAAAVPGFIGALMFLPQQLALLPQMGDAAERARTASLMALSAAAPFASIFVLLGVWLATRTARR